MLPLIMLGMTRGSMSLRNCCHIIVKIIMSLNKQKNSQNNGLFTPLQYEFAE